MPQANRRNHTIKLCIFEYAHHKFQKNTDDNHYTAKIFIAIECSIFHLAEKRL